MVFTRLLGSLGVGGPTVDTVLDPGPVRPGGALTGQVRLKGGTAGCDVELVALDLVARVEAGSAEGGGEGLVAFDRFTVGGGFRLAQDEGHDVPFGVRLPWETPVTGLHGRDLGVVLGVRTELAVSGARGKGEPDPLTVGPLPAQEAVLGAFEQLGFGFRSADLQPDRIGGTGQRLPFHQEIAFSPPPEYAQQMNEIEVTFLAHAGGMEVVLEADKRGGPRSAGHDAVTRFAVSHDGVGRQDWNAVVEGWVRQLVAHRAAYGAHAVYGHGEHHGFGDGHRAVPGTVPDEV
ncbi:sporulation protein [Streptomyces bullii]|uniref:Sporulation protein n=1 Tax=Streptomyces bullii TaxID=349910 RepID=A0ABW0UKJ9_9ACTN